MIVFPFGQHCILSYAKLLSNCDSELRFTMLRSFIIEYGDQDVSYDSLIATDNSGRFHNNSGRFGLSMGVHYQQN